MVQLLIGVDLMEVPRVRSQVPSLVSVIMPFRNEERYLPHQLGALAKQDYEGRWELVAADDGSTDRSLELVREAATRHGWQLRVVSTGGIGPGAARNCAVSVSSGELLCLCDGDDVVAAGWISAFVEASPLADFMAGFNDRDSLNSRTQRLSRASANGGAVPMFAPSGNMAIWRDVFEQVGGFDPSLRQGEDVDITLRAQASGFRMSYVPDAVLQYRFRESTARGLVQAYRMGYYGQKLRARHTESSLFGHRTESANERVVWLLIRLPYLLTDRRALWVSRMASLSGELVFRSQRRMGRAWGCRPS